MKANLKRPGAVRLVGAACGALASLLASWQGCGQEAGGGWLGPAAAAVSAEGRTLYLAAERAERVVAVDLDGKRVAGGFPVPGRPTGVSVGEDRGRLVVTCGGDRDVVVMLDPERGRVVRQWAARSGVCAPVMAGSGQALYLCSRYEGSVSLVEARSGREMAVARVSREPVAAAVSADGGTLAVANLLPVGRADPAVVRSAVSLLDARGLKLRGQVWLPNGSTSVRGVAFHPARKLCAAVHNLAPFQVAAAQVEHGWMNASALSLVDAERGELRATVLLDDVRQGAANPWAVGWSPEGRYLCVTHAGTDELSVIDFKALEQKVSGLAGGSVVMDFGFLAECRKRISLPVHGPRALAIGRGIAYVAGFFSDNMCAVEVETGTVAWTLALADGGSSDPVREGERLFHDARLSHQSWQSCASCHPDGRADGLNWDLLNDGVGNPKNTKSLVLAFQTPPAMSLGVRETASSAVRSGVRHILFSKQPEEVVVAIEAYIKSLKPVPSPYLEKGKLSRAARRGEKVFSKAGCATCHPPGLFTDLHAYNVGTGASHDKPGDKFDTPTLVELWRTAPYLHDGSAANVREVLTSRKLGSQREDENENEDEEDVFSARNPRGQHGRRSTLTGREIEDLGAYLLSL